MGVSNFNDTLPAAPSGKKNVTWQGDAPTADPRNISAYLELLVGDSGAGGTSGAVPAPASGDAAANKFLKASGAWATLPAPVIADFIDLQTLASANLTLALTKIITVLEVTTGASDRTVTLPAASTNGKAIVIIKKVDSGVGKVIIARAGSDTIDGATSQTLYLQYTGWIQLFCNSAGKWDVTGYGNIFVGDSGSGGVYGAVPAPAAGDAAANKFLKASGAWATLPAGTIVAGDYVDLQTLTSADLTLALTKLVTVLEVTTGASDRTVTLPAASTNGKAIVIIKKIDSGAGNVIVARAGSDTIDGATSQTLYFQYTGWIKLFCNSAGTWDIIGAGNRGYDAKAMDIEVNTTEYLVDVPNRNVYYPGNFSGAAGFAITNPADGTYSITVKKNGSSIGTITVTTGGVYTFTTTSGNPFTMVSGDRLSFLPPGTTDSAMAALGISLKGIC